MKEIEDLDDKFHAVVHSRFQQFLCRFTTAVKDSRHTWSLFGASIGG